MIWQESPISLLLLISAALTAVLAVIAWKNRRSPGGTALTIFLCAATIWSGAYAMELYAADLASNLLFTDIEYFGIAVIPPAFLAFSLSYTGRERLLTRNVILGFAFVTVLTIVSVLTNEFHHLYYTGFAPTIFNGVVIWQFIYGPLFWICWSIFALQILAALALLFGHLFDAPAIYRSQIVLLLIASLVPIILNVFYVLKLGPLPGFDPTPLGYLITGLTIEAATVRYRLFSITPVAWSLLPGIMTDGIVVTNEADCIAEINPAAAAIAGVSEEEAIGVPLSRIFPALVSLSAGSDGRCEVTLTAGGQPRTFVVQSHLTSEAPSGDAAGRLIVLHDVTDLLNERAALRKANEKLGLLGRVTCHDILNQLTVVGGYMELALDSTDRSEVEEDIKKSLLATGTVRRQIDFMRDYLALGTGGLQWFKLEDVARPALLYAEQHGIEASVSCSGVEVYADPLFERALFNLANNTVTHSATATAFSISCTPMGESLLVVAADNGVGVPEGEKERIFERGVGKHTGFGLFMVREILGITGMTIRETGTEGSGACFEITVPPGSFRIENDG